ncbi:hypothetical protein EC988_007708, partial [Linderina pennispora]
RAYIALCVEAIERAVAYASAAQPDQLVCPASRGGESDTSGRCRERSKQAASGIGQRTARAFITAALSDNAPRGSYWQGSEPNKH